MKYSTVEGQRQEAQPRLRGECPVCGATVIAKCGEIRVWHWSHYRKADCDHWWENETPWHREWKNRFPADWQEVIHYADDGEKHIADVKTPHGLAIEFQNSPLSADERQSREAFYKNLIWIVNGFRFRERFEIQLRRAKFVKNTPIKIILPAGYCSTLKTWSGSMTGTYIDFGDETFTNERFNFPKPILWRLLRANSEFHVVLVPVFQHEFIDSVLNDRPISGIHAPEIEVASDSKILKISTRYERRQPEQQKFTREVSESHIDYALRVWGLDRVK